MKKILLLLLIIFLNIPICFADEETIDDINSYFNVEIEQEQVQAQELHGYLEYNDAEYSEQEKNAVYFDESLVSKTINFEKPKKIETKSLISNSKKPTFQLFKNELETASKFSTQEYEISPINSIYDKKIGKFSIGTMYNSSIYSAQVNYSTGVFTKYEGKYFALSTAFSKNTNSNYDSYNDKFYIAPELKLTKRLSLLDVMQTDVNQINKKNELVLRYTPRFRKYADDVQFEVGAGQSFYEDNYIKSSLRFSTRFKL